MEFPRFFYPSQRDMCIYQPEYPSFAGLFGDILGDDFPVLYPRRVLRINRRGLPDNAKTNSEISCDPNKFQVMLNVKHFKPEELSVKTVDNSIVVHGKHEEYPDEHGFISREFTRRYPIPSGVEAEDVQSSFSRDGVLTICAPKKCPELPPKNERVVSITIQQPVTGEQGVQEQQVEESGDSK